MKYTVCVLLIAATAAFGVLFGEVSARDGVAQCPTNGWAEGIPGGVGPNKPLPMAPVPTQQAGHWANPTSNCGFHQWSWNAFVWATDFYWNPDSSAKRAPRFLSLNSPEELQATATADGPPPLRLLPRTVKPGSRIKKFQQAGSKGILVDLQHQAVLYSVHMNDEYFNFAKKYYGRAKYDEAAPTLTFPLNSAVFKASWKVVRGPSPYWFTTEATVPILAIKNGEIVIVGEKPALVALVGLHVVVRTQYHPEFIWATFEQVNNAPNLANPNDYDSNRPVSHRGYTFYTACTPARCCNQMIQGNTVHDGRFAQVNNVFRQYARGGEDQLPASQFDAINTAAQQQMRLMEHEQKMGGATVPAYPLNTVWANYMLIGTVWQPIPDGVSDKDPAPPTILPGEPDLFATAVGSVQLENSTLETFVQGPQNNGGSRSNCFMCHNTAGSREHYYPGKNINLSHVILDSLKKSK